MAGAGRMPAPALLQWSQGGCGLAVPVTALPGRPAIVPTLGVARSITAVQGGDALDDMLAAPVASMVAALCFALQVLAVTVPVDLLVVLHRGATSRPERGHLKDGAALVEAGIDPAPGAVDVDASLAVLARSGTVVLLRGGGQGHGCR